MLSEVVLYLSFYLSDTHMHHGSELRSLCPSDFPSFRCVFMALHFERILWSDQTPLNNLYRSEDCID